MEQCSRATRSGVIFASPPTGGQHGAVIPAHEESVIAALEVDSVPTPHASRDRTSEASGRAVRPVERWLLAVLLLWLLVGPRIELPGVRGLRVEDLVLGLLAALCLLHVRRRWPPSWSTVAIVAVAVTGLVSALVAGARGMVNPVDAVLFAVRPLEYWVAFPAAAMLLSTPSARWIRLFDRLLVAVTVLQTTFAVLQYYFGIPVGFSHAAYTRAAGLTVGPYELGAISAMLVVYWISRGRWAMASLSVVALAASISRISILGAGLAVAVLVVGWLVQLRRRARDTGWRSAIDVHRRSRGVVAGQVASVLAAGLVLAFTVGLIHLPAITLPTAPAAEQPAAPAPSSPTAAPSAAATEEPPADATPTGPQAPSDSIAERLATTSVLGSWNAADALAARVPHPKDSVEYQFAAYAGLNIYVNVNTASDSGVEASNLVRFFRWHLILDSFDDPVDVVFGLGPSFVGPSVDGSYLRFLADGGVLGVLAWLALIISWLRRSPFWMVCVTISLLVGAIFIDILYAERPMVLFWALLALAGARQRVERSVQDVAGTGS